MGSCVGAGRYSLAECPSVEIPDRAYTISVSIVVSEGRISIVYRAISVKKPTLLWRNGMADTDIIQYGP